MFNTHQKENIVADIIDSSYDLHEILIRNITQPLDVLVNKWLAYAVTKVMKNSNHKDSFAQLLDYDSNYCLDWNYIKTKLLNDSHHPVFACAPLSWAPNPTVKLIEMSTFKELKDIVFSATTGDDLVNKVNKDLIARYKDKSIPYKSGLIDYECTLVDYFRFYSFLPNAMVTKAKEMVEQKEKDSRMQNPLKHVSQKKLAEARKNKIVIDYSGCDTEIKEIITKTFSDDFLLDVYNRNSYSTILVNKHTEDIALLTDFVTELNKCYGEKYSKYLFNDDYIDFINTILINMNYDYSAIFDYYCKNHITEYGIYKTESDVAKGLRAGNNTKITSQMDKLSGIGFRFILLRDIVA